MKSIILAGGYARRLAPITDFIAKPLLPIGGRPIIDRIVNQIKEAGINEIMVSTNKYYEKEFRYWINCREEEIKLIIEPTKGEEEKFGAIAGINYAMNITGKDEYLVVAGDNLFDFSIKELIEFYKRKRKTVIALYDVKDIEKAKRYGVAGIDNENKVISLTEKPDNPESTLISTAMYVFPRNVKEIIEEYLSGKNNPDNPGYFISYLSKNYEVYGYPFSGLWMDIGNIDEYRHAFSMF